MPEEEMSRGNVLHTSGNPSASLRDQTMGYFAFWISLFAQRNRYVYSQARRSKFILIIVGIYMSSYFYYYYTKGERSDADE